MATCDLGYEHEDTAPVPEPVAVPVDTGPNENDVKIAEIEAEASIEREKLWNDQRGLELVAEVERQRGEISGMREVLDRLVPEPADPEPIVVPAPAPPVEIEDEADAPPEGDKPSAPPAAKKRGFF